MDNGIFLKQMGEKITFYRKAKKLTQAQLAKTCGIDLSNLGRMERGEKNPHILTIINISNALGITICQLLNVNK